MQYGQANFCAINVRNQTKKPPKLNRHQTESFDVGFSFLGLIDMNFELWNDGLLDDLYNEIGCLWKFDSARNPKYSPLPNIEDLRMHYAIEFD